MISRTLSLATLLLLAGCAKNASAPASPTTTTSSSAGTTKRVVIAFGRQVGTDVVTRSADGKLAIAFDVLENGRGPKVDATVRLAADGTIASFDAKGHHTMGTAVEETFLRDGQHATWKSKEEHGDKNVTDAVFFVPIADCPDTLGYLAEALLKAKGTLPLLPGGEAKIEKVGDATAQAGTKAKKLGLYKITGLDVLPTLTWMNEDGTWWGNTEEWASVVPEGYEAAIDGLLAKQHEVTRAEDQKLAQKLAHRPPPAGLAYTHARMFDVEHERVLKDVTVVVVGDKIVAVGPSAQVKPPAGAEIVDLAGKMLLPGLWDMHAHLGDADGVLNLASGVTTVRDVGNDPDKLDDYKKRFEDGSAIGPHVFRMGFIEGRNEKSASSKITAENEEEAKAAVAFFEKRHYDGIKIYNSMKPELVPVLAREAHARGMDVIGHIPVHMLANEAVKAGYDGIEHVNMLFLNFFADHDTDTRTPTRFTLVGDKAAGLDLKSKPVTDFIALLKAKNTVIDPTLSVFESLFVAQAGKMPPGLEPMVARLPVQTQRRYVQAGLPSEGKETLYAQSFEKTLAMTKALTDAKITVVAGTDDLAGLTLQHELALFVRAGIPAARALKMATLDPARVLKVDGQMGSIAPKKEADMFVVDGDPTTNIADLSKVTSTMRGGIVFDAAAAFATVGIRP